MKARSSYYRSLPYVIELIPDLDNEGEWYARIPRLRGCIADGSNQAEALQAWEIVKRLWIEVALEHGDEVPEPLPQPESIK